MSSREEVLVFSNEGRHNMKECLQEAFERSRDEQITKIVIFSATGEGPVFALQELLGRPEYHEIELTAVTPPVNRRYRLDSSR